MYQTVVGSRFALFFIAAVFCPSQIKKNLAQTSSLFFLNNGIH